VSCGDHTFKDSDEIDPGTQWAAAGAQELWEALIWEYQKTGHKKNIPIHQYIAETLSVDDASFKCDDDSNNNACSGYGPAGKPCVSLNRLN